MERDQTVAAIAHQKSQPPTAQDYYYFRCHAVGESSPSTPCKKTTTDSEPGVLPIFNRYNILNGARPHVPVTVEDIPEYFTEDNYRHCVSTIRTIGIVRRYEHESYMLESVNQTTNRVQIPLTRGINRDLRTYKSIKRIIGSGKERKVTKKKKLKQAETNANENSTKVSATDLPYPDFIQDPLQMGDTRVKDGTVYLVLGTLQWVKGEPMIDAHRFIYVHDLKSTYESFMLQHAIARRHIDFYKPHPEEIREVVRRPNEKREPAFPRTKPTCKRANNWQK
ncbi:uncharacterized protein LOC124183648 [Neodiprion fabricii]|uniref:uncharacterized protein LOC124183648 n=1 Tax=Neodiprion fabricii TaxID=2872261 RepID=UPI001ED97EDD|nr:uncharacterized protein LOC124183648 [Neodiprion fabricii]XP_046428330.1 uncharacterized protein LOC124183648 [Neodiprion fabricii]